jgi:hypothetical protein
MTDKIRIATKARRTKKSIHRKVLGIPLSLLVIMVAMVAAAAVILLGPISAPVTQALHQMKGSITGIPAETIWGNQFAYTYINVTLVGGVNTYTGAHNAFPLLAFDTGGASPCTTLSTTNFKIIASTSAATTSYNITYGAGTVGTSVSNGPGFYSSTQCVFFATMTFRAVAGGALTDTWPIAFKFQAVDPGLATLVITTQFGQ